MWELASELPPVTLTGRQRVPTDTTRIIRMPAHLMGTMALSGLTVEYLLGRDRGITGAGDMADTGAVRGIGGAATDTKAGATTGEESTHVAAMVAVIAEVTRTAVTPAATPEAMASMAQAVTTAAEVTSTAVGEVSTEEADLTVADTGNSVKQA